MEHDKETYCKIYIDPLIHHFGVILKELEILENNLILLELKWDCSIKKAKK